MDGTDLVTADKRLEQNAFKWPTIREGVLRLDPAQFEALFAGLDWRRVTALEDPSTGCGRMTRAVFMAGG